ncbi:RNA polymerase sigma factor YlaC [soil metagenome]
MTERDYNDCVNLYADNVYRFILKNLGHAEDAQDVVQSSFEKLWINRDKVEHISSKSYLFKVAYNNMIDHIRKNKRIVYKEDFKNDVRTTAQQHNHSKKLLQQALSKLSETQRSLVLLKDYEGYRYEEIAEITNLSVSQVKVYLHRARITLKNYLVSAENVI